MDLLPPGTVISLTLVVQPQDVLEARFTHLAKNAIGKTANPRGSELMRKQQKLPWRTA